MRLIAFDLDGTLLDHDKTVPRRSLDVIARLREHGCVIAVITGRSRLPDDVVEGVRPEAIGTSNGAVVRVGDRLLAEHALTSEQVRAIDALLPPQADVWAFGPEAVFTRHPEKAQADWLAGRRLAPLRDIHEKVHQLSFWVPGARTHAARISELGDLTLTGGIAPYESFMTVTHGLATKGHALREIADALGIPMEHTIVFGDSDNDIAMFREAGVAVQVGEAECLTDVAHHRVSCAALGLPGWLEDYTLELARELA